MKLLYTILLYELKKCNKLKAIAFVFGLLSIIELWILHKIINGA